MEHAPEDYDDPAILAEWHGEQREHVLEYLAEEEVNIKNVEDCVPDEPAFSVAPYLAVWPVLFPDDLEYVAFWVISGDLPTDYVSADDAEGPRQVLAHFSKMWAEVAESMKAGEEHPEVTIGTPEDWPMLAPILESRAAILKKFADDDELWEEVEDEDE